jgi:hypothetical protein
VGAFNRPHDPGAQTIAYTGVGFVPRGFFFSSWSLAQQLTGDEEARVSFSAVDTTTTGATFTPNQRAIFVHDKIDNSDGDRSWARKGTLGSAGVNGQVIYMAQAGDCPPAYSELETPHSGRPASSPGKRGTTTSTASRRLDQNDVTFMNQYQVDPPTATRRMPRSSTSRSVRTTRRPWSCRRSRRAVRIRR